MNSSQENIKRIEEAAVQGFLFSLSQATCETWDKERSLEFVLEFQRIKRLMEVFL